MKNIAPIWMLLVLGLLVQAVYGQKKTGHLYISPNVGTMYYVGELKGDGLPDRRYLQFSKGISLKYKIKNSVVISAGYMRGKLSGADTLVDNSSIRKFHFRSSLDEAHLTLKVNLANHNLKQKRKDQVIITPGLLGGLGLVWFNPEAELNGIWYELQPLGTEGQNIEGNGSPYKLNSMAYKIGAELSFFVNRNVDIDVFSIWTSTFTDYLDDVSGNYPNQTELLLAPNGALASQFSSRDSEGPARLEEQTRGNPATNDGYWNFGVGVTVKLTGERRSTVSHRRKRLVQRKAKF